MQTHIATGAHTYRASTAVPAGFRARLAVLTTCLQRVPLPLLQLLFRLAYVSHIPGGGQSYTSAPGGTPSSIRGTLLAETA